MPSNNSNADDQSIWEILEQLETKMLESIHSTSEVVIPQLIDASNQVYNQVETISKQLYDKAIESGLTTSDRLPSFITGTPRSNSNPELLIRPGEISTNSIPRHSDHPLLFRRYLKLRYLLIGTGIVITSNLLLDFILSTNSYQNFLRSNPTLKKTLPRWLKSRARRLKPNRPRYSTGGQTRLEAVVILGANPGSVGYQLATHLISSGFIVIASVSSSEYVSQLETDGLGWIKALVLDPNQPQSARAFNRSLAACLSLRFPLNSPGDAFLNSDAQHSTLVSLVNCLPISLSYDLKPVENLLVDDDLLDGVNRLAGISLEVIKVVLPMMRNSIEKFGAEDAVILTLFPTKTSSVPLPYLSSSFIANQTLENLMKNLRRELMISNSDSHQSIRVINEKIGLFKSGTALFGLAKPAPTPISLPVHLHPIYAPSLSRRIAFLNLPTTHLPILSNSGSPLSLLIQRVTKVIQSPQITVGSTTKTGKEVWKYKIIQSIMPDRMVETWLRMVERINGWVRQQVNSEIDLESQENLERVIEKRKLSESSGWKHGVFAGHVRIPMNDDLQQTMDNLPEEEDSQSVVDKGEEPMQESFVGSEIDWKGTAEEVVTPLEELVTPPEEDPTPAEETGNPPEDIISPVEDTSTTVEPNESPSEEVITSTSDETAVDAEETKPET